MSNFTASELTAVMVAVSALVAAVFTGIVNIIVALRTERKVDTVAVAVNGHASVATAKISELRQQVVALTATVSDAKQVAALLAQEAQMNATMRQAPASVLYAPPSPDKPPSE